MIHYEDFQNEALEIAGSAGIDWKHLLPAIPIAFRNRYVQTLEHGFTIPEAYDMIMLSQSSNEQDYNLFLQKAIEKKEEKKQKDATKVS